MNWNNYYFRLLFWVLADAVMISCFLFGPIWSGFVVWGVLILVSILHYRGEAKKGKPLTKEQMEAAIKETYRCQEGNCQNPAYCAFNRCLKHLKFAPNKGEEKSEEI